VNEKRLKDLFKQTKYNPDSRLSGDILATINAKERTSFILNLWIYGSLVIISFSGVVFVIENLIYQLSQSGFYEYSALIFSDMNSVAVYWRELSMSLIGSIPVVNIIISLVLIFIILISIRSILNQFKFRNQLALAY